MGLMVRPFTGSNPSRVHAATSASAGAPFLAGPGSQAGQTGARTLGSMLAMPIVISVAVTPRAVAPPPGSDLLSTVDGPPAGPALVPAAEPAARAEGVPAAVPLDVPAAGAPLPAASVPVAAALPVARPS